MPTAGEDEPELQERADADPIHSSSVTPVLILVSSMNLLVTPFWVLLGVLDVIGVLDELASDAILSASSMVSMPPLSVTMTFFMLASAMAPWHVTHITAITIRAKTCLFFGLE